MYIGHPSARYLEQCTGVHRHMLREDCNAVYLACEAAGGRVWAMSGEVAAETIVVDVANTAGLDGTSNKACVRVSSTNEGLVLL